MWGEHKATHDWPEINLLLHKLPNVVFYKPYNFGSILTLTAALNMALAIALILILAVGLNCNNAMVLIHQLRLRFNMIRIKWNAIYRAYLNTLRCFKMTNTLSAQSRIDLIDLYTLRDCTIRTFGLTNIAIYTFVCDDKRHE